MSDFRNAERFLGLDDDSSQRGASAAWVLPIPFEMTTSYTGGTKLGPAAIIEASTQVELYDAEFKMEAALDYGVHTLPTLHPSLASAEAANHSIAQAVQALELDDRVLVTLGGEHSITPAVIRGLASRHPNLVVVQIDAHSDLRDSYDDTPWSHACAARRWLDLTTHTLQFGIRSVSQEEADFSRTAPNVTIYSALQMYQDPARHYLSALKTAISGRNVYLTIDVDGLDPSVIPATGTPEPGGIGWYDCLDLIRTVAQNSRVIAFDCVELAPTLGSQASNFAAAKLVYKTLNLIMHARGRLEARR